ncbi:MAG TPA: phosphoribosylanthranilate isomerase [Candidatus Syntrophoarchaeum butanivorans]|uniref:N-(5'-phosphoribosyl)anthranilate isomerase n=1 Tax=Candidatus Syntropharchaeum butanivorans TaxID=1839936 RepID=A0A1F2P6N4_9EURY|nr:MAG: phosphoribosylanthranilate isomerase [Candidatus Syntrophoarchaeum butanivorans]HEC57608.1 phosphoribosylanthranilate isomerase [Candidatus Syntrophoarchaeum butanivorans]
MTFIKICGIRTEQDLRIVVGAGVDAAGFIIEVPVETPRKISRWTASGLVRSLPGDVLGVAVLMPASIDEAVEIIDLVEPDMVQIHSDMDPNRLYELKERCDLPLIKVLGIRRGVDRETILSEVDHVSGVVDFILLDTKLNQRSGGTGEVHDWSVSREVVRSSPVPVILAGGLNPLNVGDAIKFVRPYGVDTASGVETGGRKDPDKVRRFVEAVRRSGG